MITLVAKYEPDCPVEIKKLCATAKDQGFFLSEADAEAAWHTYSDSLGAGWLTLKGNEVCLIGVMPFLEKRNP